MQTHRLLQRQLFRRQHLFGRSWLWGSSWAKPSDHQRCVFLDRFSIVGPATTAATAAAGSTGRRPVYVLSCAGLDVCRYQLLRCLDAVRLHRRMGVPPPLPGSAPRPRSQQQVLPLHLSFAGRLLINRLAVTVPICCFLGPGVAGPNSPPITPLSPCSRTFVHLPCRTPTASLPTPSYSRRPAR